MAARRRILRGACGARLGKAASAALLGLSALLGVACEDASDSEATPSGTAHDRAGSAAAIEPASEEPTRAVDAPEPEGDAARGRELVAQFECARCHDGTEAAPKVAATPVAAVDAPLDTKHCFSCHADILAGKLDHKPDAARWKKNVAHLVAAPTLTSIGARIEYDWIVDYLVDPHDLRPNLAATMPPLAITREQARDVATYLVGLSGDTQPPAVDLADADPNRGRQLMVDKGCGSCHRLGGAALPELAGTGEGKETRVAVMLAPDLRFARDRWSASSLVQWIRDPMAMKADTKMPQTPMTDDEAMDIAAYLLRGELPPLEPHVVPALPEPLDRPVSYDEVAERVLNKTCRHCHGDPDVALGDGGPGNTGGFGYPARGLELTSYERVSAGYRDEAGERHSVFGKTSDGTPRLVAALMARHAEVAGEPNPEVRGMPLGLPPLPIEDIQLVVTWIEQGRSR
ncbi:MAG: cytochrome c [Polyangiaceae bacterium]